MLLNSLCKWLNLVTKQMEVQRSWVVSHNLTANQTIKIQGRDGYVMRTQNEFDQQSNLIWSASSPTVTHKVILSWVKAKIVSQILDRCEFSFPFCKASKTFKNITSIFNKVNLTPKYQGGPINPLCSFQRIFIFLWCLGVNELYSCNPFRTTSEQVLGLLGRFRVWVRF